MKKIVFIFFQPPTLFHEQNYYFKELIKVNFEIEVWDITNIIFREMSLPDEIDRYYIKKLHSKNEFKECFSKTDINDTIFISCMSYNYDSLWIYKLFSKHKYLLYSFERANFSAPTKTILYSISRINNLISNHNIIQYLKRIYVHLLRKIKFIRRYDNVFATGAHASQALNNSHNVIPINNFDYDRYLTIPDSPSSIGDSRYCVFLDDGITSSPDLKILNIKPIDSSLYFEKINDYINDIEQKNQLKVVVALHPKTVESEHLFKNRLCIKYKTGQLIKDSEFVITHTSSSVSYAVLFKKPILFIFTDEIKKTYYYNLYASILALASELGYKSINIDNYDKNNIIIVPSINHKKYEQYKYTYLTSKDTENQLSKDIVINHLLKI
jgi:hypothetical protein